ncbi:MAG: hypothetical protein NZ528_11855 [Caldilineales bacterium]|nr:hypothetical protein [Caldilineales bacterium]MDW8319062.1 hypothetical protein [Anaerolineae bacterium]
MKYRKIGLLISAEEEDWPTALEILFRRYNPPVVYNGEPLNVEIERVRVHPFDLRAGTSYHLVVDRLGHWQLNPREWIKKAALYNRVYLLNSPFTFQSMEKHSAYVAMMRLGLHVPKTWLIPLKSFPNRPGYEETARKYYDWFDLPAIAAREFGYPLYMKPFDGGGWRGVSRINNQWELMAAYDSSGQTMMHLQTALDNYEAFVRALGIGPQVQPMRYQPEQPQHARYAIDNDFLSPERRREIIAITKVINAFFHWEVNSCEAILKDGLMQPIDYANACPDMHVTSLHFYFPWAVKALFAWITFCLATDRRMRLDSNMEEYFAIADTDMGYWEKLAAYEALADRYFETERFNEFCQKHLGWLDEAVWEFVQTPEFDGIIWETVRYLFPPHEHEQFFHHYRGILNYWVQATASAAASGRSV